MCELECGSDPEQSAADTKAAWKAVRQDLKSRLADASPPT